MKEITNVVVKDIYSAEFNTMKGFNEAYKQVKQSFFDQLGISKIKNGQIILLGCLDGNNFIKLTSSDKETMKEYIKKFKDANFKLFIKGQEYKIIFNK